jgi:hypothetical protein
MGFSPGRSDTRNIDRPLSGAAGSKLELRFSLFLY